MTSVAAISRKVAWGRVMTLAAAAFVFNTTEYIPVGLLSDIGWEFGLPDSQVGTMLTVYAWIVALTSLPLMLILGRVNRRLLMMVVFSLFTASHLLTYLAWNYDVLLISRIGVAIAHALFWSVTASLTVSLAPPGRKASALGLLSASTALASVMGLPLGRIISQIFSWRETFLIIGLAAFLILCFIFKMLPDYKPTTAGSLRSLPGLFRRPELTGVYGLMAVSVTGHFTVFTYIETFTLEAGGYSSNFATLLLFVLGGAGVAGSVVFARYATKNLQVLLSGAMLLLTGCLLLLNVASSSHASLLGLCVLWGGAFMVTGMGLQFKVLNLAEDATDVAMSIASAVINIGIGSGALLGNSITSGMGVSCLGYAGGTLCAVALIGAFYLFRNVNFTHTHEEVSSSSEVS
ncbi:sugar transporter [Pantoea agglomerans]|uniref:sugar transporter n=1 Tax=Enterobacter agglomerans TaxID=549 RepID=UPI00320A1009